MHSASVERSERLKRVLAVLENAGGRKVTSLELATLSHTIAPSTCISELRHQGFPVRCEQAKVSGKRVWQYWIEKGPQLANPMEMGQPLRQQNLFGETR